MASCLIQHVDSFNSFVDSLSAQLDLPQPLSHDLDALYDELLEITESPIIIEWDNTQAARQALGADVFTTLVEILRSVARERGDLHLHIN